MTKLLKGKEVTDELNKKMKNEVFFLKKQGIRPCLGIMRVGENLDDIAYEESAIKRAEKIGIETKRFIFEEKVTQDKLIETVKKINEDNTIHGLLMLRPLPKHIDDDKVRNTLFTQKDVDGITDGSMAGVYSGGNIGFPPCTAEACIEILNDYKVEIIGKKAVIIGRSLVIGRPVAMMLMKENATVTICHTKTKNMEAVAKESDILIVAAGRAGIVGKEFFNEKQIVIDVGINVDEEGQLKGDVLFEEADGKVSAITPVPGGVGTVTTSLLLNHVIKAAKKGKIYER